MTIFKKQIGDKAKTILRNYNKYPQRNLIGFIIPRKILIKKKKTNQDHWKKQSYC